MLPCTYLQAVTIPVDTGPLQVPVSEYFSLLFRIVSTVFHGNFPPGLYPVSYIAIYVAKIQIHIQLPVYELMFTDLPNNDRYITYRYTFTLTSSTSWQLERRRRGLFSSYFLQ